MVRALPPSASVVQTGAEGRLFAPSAARNIAPICSTLHRIGLNRGRALEIASGTGQHIVEFAAQFQDVAWQPSEIDPDRCASIEAHRTGSRLGNIAPVIILDACVAGWSKNAGPFDFVIVVNLLHLIRGPEAEIVISEALEALVPGGRFMIYGPFKRDAALMSPADAVFDAELRKSDPLIGYKDSSDIARWVKRAGAKITDLIEMPANNLAIVMTR